MLDGKPNTAGQDMVVTIVGDWGNTIDQNAIHGIAQSASPSMSSDQLSHQSSRFSGTFQSMEKMSALFPLQSHCLRAVARTSNHGSHPSHLPGPQYLSTLEPAANPSSIKTLLVMTQASC